ncbi:hypothetical protein M9979_09525 [Sphingomonas sp. RP10(2022)]|uniref:Uncharacterized protein n=1 Tax=Sphingomonas liriopis TaxID=2949094 RepID=A0A9X2HRF9_9SPHN|nr:hypothetical protein [Sphingomonas liriopis]MCP3735107.1 hypothetical protein [Sphingomonas liriopis]
MAAFSRPSLNLPDFAASGLTRWIAPAGGALAGLAVAALFLLLPDTVLEDWVWRSGLPSLVAAAEPPLGTTARAVLTLAGGGLAAAVVWSALFLLFGPGGLLTPKAVAVEGVPVLRRADAHPDAPARRPLSAADLGVPTPPEDVAPVAPPPPPVVQAIPVDLDLPLAAFHPGALPDVPREPVRPVAPLRPPVALVEGERIATVQLPRSPAESTTAPSIEALLKRLEQSARRPLRA